MTSNDEREALACAIRDLEATYEAARSGRPLEITVGQFVRLARMKDTLASLPAPAMTQSDRADITEWTEAEDCCDEARRTLNDPSRSDLHRVIHGVLRSYRMTNMHYDDGDAGFPLVDLMSNDPPADISTGEMEMVWLTDELCQAINARFRPRSRPHD